MTQDEIDARRYRWLINALLADDSSDFDRIMAHPEPLDVEQANAVIDAAMADEPRYTITAKGKSMLEGK